jgi:hypothetical protein
MSPINALRSRSRGRHRAGTGLFIVIESCFTFFVTDGEFRRDAFVFFSARTQDRNRGSAGDKGNQAKIADAIRCMFHSSPADLAP